MERTGWISENGSRVEPVEDGPRLFRSPSFGIYVSLAFLASVGLYTVLIAGGSLLLVTWIDGTIPERWTPAVISGLVLGGVCGWTLLRAPLATTDLLAAPFARRVLSRERDGSRLVHPTDDRARFVEMTPLDRLGRVALESATDMGFIRAEGSVVLFEGDHQRYALQAEDVASVHLIPTSNCPVEVPYVVVDLSDDARTASGDPAVLPAGRTFCFCLRGEPILADLGYAARRERAVELYRALAGVLDPASESAS